MGTTDKKTKGAQTRAAADALGVDIPASTADLARYAHSIAQRRGLVPQDCSLAQFIEDAVYERAATLVLNEIGGWYAEEIGDEPRTVNGEGRRPHHLIIGTST